MNDLLGCLASGSGTSVVIVHFKQLSLCYLRPLLATTATRRTGIRSITNKTSYSTSVGAAQKRTKEVEAHNSRFSSVAYLIGWLVGLIWRCRCRIGYRKHPSSVHRLLGLDCRRLSLQQSNPLLSQCWCPFSGIPASNRLVSLPPIGVSGKRRKGERDETRQLVAALQKCEVSGLPNQVSGSHSFGVEPPPLLRFPTAIIALHVSPASLLLPCNP